MSEEMTPDSGVSELSVDDAAIALMDSWEESETEDAETSDDATDETEAIDAEADSEEGETEEDDADIESEDDDLQEADEEDQEQLDFESVQDIADALEMPLEEFMAKLKATVKVGDEESQVTFDELQRGYQREADYTQKTQALSESRRQFEEQSANELQQLHAQQQEAQVLLSLAQTAIMGDYQKVDWNALEPGERALYQQHIQQRAQGVEQAKQKLMQQFQQQAEQAKTQADERAKHVKEREFDLLVSKIPAWVDKSTLEREGAQLSKFLMDNGYSQEELAQAADHRALHMAYQFMKLSEQAAGVEKAKTKVAKAPKMLKPNAKHTKESRLTNQTKKLRANLRKSGSVADAAALIESTL